MGVLCPSLQAGVTFLPPFRYFSSTVSQALA
jgi:hypothetical protein